MHIEQTADSDTMYFSRWIARARMPRNIDAVRVRSARALKNHLTTQSVTRNFPRVFEACS